jgi:hypothetical protein
MKRKYEEDKQLQEDLLKWSERTAYMKRNYDRFVEPAPDVSSGIESSQKGLSLLLDIPRDLLSSTSAACIARFLGEQDSLHLHMVCKQMYRPQTPLLTHDLQHADELLLEYTSRPSPFRVRLFLHKKFDPTFPIMVEVSKYNMDPKWAKHVSITTPTRDRWRTDYMSRNGTSMFETWAYVVELLQTGHTFNTDGQYL